MHPDLVPQPSDDTLSKVSQADSVSYARKLVYFVVNVYMLAIRNWIAHIAVPFSKYYNWTHLASDGKRSNHGVSIERSVVYGPLRGEELDILSPTEEYASGSMPILYVHGGGFVCVHRGVMNHSVTPLVRAGFTVYSMDYPLAPEHKYPVPVVSILRALHFLKATYGVTSVKIVADSAGGCLAAKAASVIHNPQDSWHPLLKAAVAELEFPTIDQIALLYTICDIDSWKLSESLSTYGLVQNAILSYCMHQFRSAASDKITLIENVDKVLSFPPTFLLCGDADPLRHSHAVLASHLSTIDVPVTNLVMTGFHGFHGLPAPFSLGLWRSTVFPANVELIKWLTNNDFSRVPALPPARLKGEHDFSLLVVLGILHAVVAYTVSVVLANIFCIPK